MHTLPGFLCGGLFCNAVGTVEGGIIVVKLMPLYRPVRCLIFNCHVAKTYEMTGMPHRCRQGSDQPVPVSYTHLTLPTKA